MPFQWRGSLCYCRWASKQSLVQNAKLASRKRTLCPMCPRLAFCQLISEWNFVLSGKEKEKETQLLGRWWINEPHPGHEGILQDGGHLRGRRDDVELLGVTEARKARPVRGVFGDAEGAPRPRRKTRRPATHLHVLPRRHHHLSRIVFRYSSR